MYNSHEERALIDGGEPSPRTGRGRRRRLERARTAAAGPIQEEIRRPSPLCDLRRTHRRQQGLRRDVRLLPAVCRARAARPRPDPRRVEAPATCPRIRASSTSGFLPEEDKFDAIAAADVLIMPSPYESLSMVTLEAWALGRPVLVNARCDVLRGQCARSNAGLFYENVDEFCEGLFALESTGPAGPVLGRNGREYFRRNYTWPVIERKYLDMFDRLKREPRRAAMEPLPGFFARRRRNVPAAGNTVLDAVPSGRRCADATRSPGSRVARLRRCHRQPRARHPARACSPPDSSPRSSWSPPIRGSKRCTRRLSRRARRSSIPAICSSITFRSDRGRRARRSRCRIR